jgi:glutaredoxin
MEFESPSKLIFTIYSKSGCHNCTNVKNLLKEKNISFNMIDCDDYLIEDKDNFLQFINNIANKDCKIFPMVFFDEKFIGGYNETIEYINKNFLSFEEI